MFTPDLGRIGLPSFANLDALPTPPLITFSLEAGCKCYRYFHQFTNIIFLHAPVCFHELSSED